MNWQQGVKSMSPVPQQADKNPQRNDSHSPHQVYFALTNQVSLFIMNFSAPC